MVEPTEKRCQGVLSRVPLLWALLVPIGLSAVEPIKLSLGSGTVIRFTTPSPVLVGDERLPEVAIDADGNGKVAGLTLKRSIEKVGGGYWIRLSVTNTRSTPVALKSLTPLQIIGPNMLVADTAIPQWTVFRLARHKNDIPGPYRPTVLNDASRDAATDNSGGTYTDEPASTAQTTARYHSDPGFVVMADGKPTSTHLFIGFDGQTEHLNDVVIELDKDRREMARVAAVAEFDGVLLPPGATRETHPLYIQSGKDSEALLADHVERIRKRYGWRLADLRNIYCTWYFYGPEIVADDLRKDLAEMKKRPILFDTFLIDFGWSDNFGDWNANSGFPDGMKAMADEIRAAGLAPGIWSAPFLLKPSSAALQKYPDLPLKDRTGKRVTFENNMGAFYVVDPTSPSAEVFLTETVQKLHGWGYRYLKFDFLRSMVLNDGAVFHDRSINRAQAYRRAMDILRKAAGNEALIGTWGGLYEANAGIININRSGSDVRGHWDPVRDYGYETRYPVRMRQTFARSFYDEKLWTSDQDALQLRRRDTPWRTTRPHLPMGIFTDEEAFSTVVYRFLGGGVVQVSEKLDELAHDRYDLYKMVIPTYATVARRFGDWSDYLPEYFVSHFANHKSLPAWSVVTLCNWNGNAAKKLPFTIASVPGLPKANRYAAFEFKTQRFLGVFRPEEKVELELGSHAARVIRLTPLGGDGSYFIGSDLNMSVGMELEGVLGKQVKLKPAVAGFGARLTFLDWRNGKGTLDTVEQKPDRIRAAR